MALNPQLEPLTLPDGTEFPGTPQELLALIAQYMAITGFATFNGINFGSTTPTTENQDKPWFKTDISDNPIGWFAWDGAAWVAIPIILPSGTTAQRPVSPGIGTVYYDTDIEVSLIYTGALWTTLSGSPGDVKAVKAASLAAALTANPGWSHDADSIGRVIAGSAADGSDNQDTAGADTITLTEGQLPPHKHQDLVVTGSEADSGDAGDFAVVAASQSVGLRTIAASETGNTGDGDDVDVRQKTVYYFWLVKD